MGRSGHRLNIDQAHQWVGRGFQPHQLALLRQRLGQRLRVAGTAEFNGYNTELNTVRCQMLLRRTLELFPQLKPAGEPEYWCGLRPTTPSNVPCIGRSKIPNLYVNTGHGTLGWTMACGSGQVLADLVAGRQPEVSVKL